MTANLTIPLDERNNVLKVPNAALRVMPQDARIQRSGSGNSNGQGRRQWSGNGNTGSDQSARSGNGSESRFAPPTAPVLAGQTRLVWVLGDDGTPQNRRIKVGLTDGASTEV